MTQYVLGELAVADLERFLDVFGSAGQERRAAHGCRGARVFAPADDHGRVLVLLEWPDRAAFEAFRSDPDVPATMASGGALGRPTFTVLDHLADLDA